MLFSWKFYSLSLTYFEGSDQFLSSRSWLYFLIYKSSGSCLIGICKVIGINTYHFLKFNFFIIPQN